MRKAQNLTQAQLAEGICNQSLISRIEKGECLPTIEMFYRIARRLGVKKWNPPGMIMLRR
ncbi:MAG: helix-turn-helix transcriptional regulator [Bacillaceae bacterium]|nr:helix-turn-helix transcriptional regulator [Bacillaceae bacterium]